jgi:hypothetical protein
VVAAVDAEPLVLVLVPVLVAVARECAASERRVRSAGGAGTRDAESSMGGRPGTPESRSMLFRREVEVRGVGLSM